MIALIRVDPNTRWFDAKPYLIQALEKGGGSRDWTLEDIRERLMDGPLDLWLLMDEVSVIGAGVTDVMVFPKRRVLEVLLFACQPHTEFQSVLPVLTRYAREIGADAIQGTGRPGWARKLKARERIIWEVEVESWRG